MKGAEEWSFTTLTARSRIRAMDKKVIAIVTRAVPYRESDMVLTLVSPEEGRITASARGCLKPRAKLRFAAEPMNFGEYMLAGKGDRYIVTDCVQYDAFSPVTADLDKFYSACMILELLSKLSPEPQPGVFIAAVNALKAMAYEGKEGRDSACDFLLEALREGGNGLDLTTCAECGCVLDGEAALSEGGGVMCKHCAPWDSVKVDASSRAFMAGEERDVPEAIKIRANRLLADFLYRTQGVRPDSSYFKEQE